MKTPLELPDPETSTDADRLLQQYRLSSKPLPEHNEQGHDLLLTPFLLSIPVIVMLIILIYNL